MAYSTDELRETAERAGMPLDYLMRLQAAEERDPQDPDGNHTLQKQLTVVFDHHVAKCLASPDPVGALLQFGFTETAEALNKA